MIKAKIKFISFMLAITTPFMLLKGDKQENNYTQYISMVSSILNTYNFSEQYNTNFNANLIKWAANHTDENHDEENIDVPYLCDLIIENSNNYSVLSPFTNDTLENNESNIIYELFCKCLFDAINTCLNSSNNIDEDYCRFKNLKIAIGTILEENVIASHNNENNLIMIDFEKMKLFYQIMYPKYEISLEQYLYYTLLHEFSHVKQQKCDCRTKQANETVSVRCFTSFIESSAESAIYNYYNVGNDKYNHSYENEREQESLALLMAAFKENRSIEQYYNAIFDSNLKELFDFFGLKSNKDIKTFYNILYSFDTLNLNTLTATNLVPYSYNDYSLFSKKVGHAYKTDIMKIAVSDLMNAIIRDNLTINQSLFLYNFIKTNLFCYDGLNNDDNFIKCVNEIEEFFNSFIGDYYNISKEEIESFVSLSIYNKYFSNLENCDDDEIKYLIEKYPLLTIISKTIKPDYLQLTYFEEVIEKSK